MLTWVCILTTLKSHSAWLFHQIQVPVSSSVKTVSILNSFNTRHNDFFQSVFYTDFEGGELLFSTSAMADGSQSKPEFEYDHRQGYGVFHLGSKLHQALPIDAGERWSLVFWMRSSQIRALQCPMCRQTPSLEPAPGFGDGFKML